LHAAKNNADRYLPESNYTQLKPVLMILYGMRVFDDALLELGCFDICRLRISAWYSCAHVVAFWTACFTSWLAVFQEGNSM